MLTFVVTLRNGRRYTVRAEEVRQNYDCYVELVASSADPAAGRQVVAMFDRNDVMSIISRDHLVSEEQSEPAPHVIRGDAIPF